jgi:predicted MFS family arabinose efflux permease
MIGLDGRIVSPLLPSMARDFHTSLAVASYSVSFYLLPYGIFQLGYGPLADRFGKLRVVSLAMLAFSAGTAACGAFDSLRALLVLRAATGAAAAALIPLTIAHIGDTVPYAKRQATLGLLMASSGAAQSLSTSAGGLLATWISWRSIFPLVGGLSLLATAWLFREGAGAAPPAPQTDARNSPTYAEALRSPLQSLLAFVFVEGALFMGVFPFLSGLLEARFRSTPLAIGLVLGAAGVAQVVVAKALPWIARYSGEERSVLIGAGAMSVAYLSCSRAPSPAWTALSAASLGVGFTLCHSTLQTRATEAFPRARGRALALFAFSLCLGGGSGTFLMAWLCETWGYGRSFNAAGVAFLVFGALASRTIARTEPAFGSAAVNADAAP